MRALKGGRLVRHYVGRAPRTIKPFLHGKGFLVAALPGQRSVQPEKCAPAFGMDRELIAESLFGGW